MGKIGKIDPARGSANDGLTTNGSLMTNGRLMTDGLMRDGAVQGSGAEPERKAGPSARQRDERQSTPDIDGPSGASQMRQDETGRREGSGESTGLTDPGDQATKPVRTSALSDFDSSGRGRVTLAGFIVLVAIALTSVVPIDRGVDFGAIGEAVGLPDPCPGPVSLGRVDCWLESNDPDGPEASPTRTVPEAVVVARTLPEISRPESGAKDLLRLLRDLPAEPPVAAQISSPYGWRRNPFPSRPGERQFHRGIDFDVPRGTFVVAPAPGVVVAARRGRDYGRHLRIQHESGFETRLAHLDNLFVEVGDRVRRGELVATSGGDGPEAGRSTGPHLHFEIRRAPKGRGAGDAVDPARVFDLYWEAWDAVQAYPRARLHASYPPYALSPVRPMGRVVDGLPYATDVTRHVEPKQGDE